MIEIDGSQKSGSGTILRLSIALSAITGKPLHITNIRQNRPQPGLKHQHLESVLTAAKICNATLDGAALGSHELWFTPQGIEGGRVEAEIATAGSITMLFMTVLPICLFAKKPVIIHVSKGGTDTIHAPTINYLKNVFFQALKRMNVDADVSIQKYGYYPKGMGETTLTVKPNCQLNPFQLEDFGKLEVVWGVSVCTFLADKQVAKRQAIAARDCLAQRGYDAQIQIINDESNRVQKGSSIVLWTQTNTGVLIGSDAIGELRKMSEVVGREAAEKLLNELSAQPTVDVFLADMLIPYIALAKGKSVFLVRTISEHIESNIWLMERMLNVKFVIEKVNSNLYRIEKS
jgi:RNA 3'-terminal phosphate cyclase (ATP)